MPGTFFAATGKKHDVTWLLKRVYTVGCLTATSNSVHNATTPLPSCVPSEALGEMC